MSKLLMVAVLLVCVSANAKDIPDKWFKCVNRVEKECKTNIGKLPPNPKDATDEQKSAVEDCIQAFLKCSEKYLPKEN